MTWENTSKVLEEYAAAVRNSYQDHLIESDKIASGELLNSCEYRIITGGTEVSVVLDLANYWKYVEYGRKAGKWPPIDKIRDWIKVKPVLPTEMTLKNGKKRLPTENQLAYLIARKIGTEGIEPKHLLRDTLEVINAQYEARIEEALGKDVDENASLILLEFIKK